MYLVFDHSGQQIVIVVAQARERLAKSKEIKHTFHVEKFDLKNLNEVEN
jgi:hypothetical protein